ncbi:DUF1926 domain-containing protein, partial [bacterium]|nr:DUF1926 domain-containing protein [candidate division CSSED10-310 bacterium]
SKAIHEYEHFESQLKDCNLFDQYKVYVRGGFWRNFLAKYPESNNMHKKSLLVSEKIEALSKKYSKNKLLLEAQDHLWAGQCNCPYWHGVFGGLYLNNIRYAVYSHMIKAETLLDKLAAENQGKAAWIDVNRFDFDADGREEVLVETNFWNLYFAPNRGGSIFEMDYKPKSINLLDTMSRREEGYHRKLLSLPPTNPENNNGNEVASIHDHVVSKEENLHEHLHYDWYRRCSLIDHFFSPGTDIESVKSCRYQEAGNFVLGTYTCETKRQNDKLNIVMVNEGSVNVAGQARKIQIEKVIGINADNASLTYEYKLRNLEDTSVQLWFGIEFNYSLLAGNAHDRYYHFPGVTLEDSRLASTGVVKNVRKAGLKDEWIGIDIQLSFNALTDMWRFPIETISQSEGGFEKVYQSSVLMPNWQIELSARKEWTLIFSQKIIE